MAGKGIKRHGFALKYDTNRIHFSGLFFQRIIAADFYATGRLAKGGK